MQEAVSAPLLITMTTSSDKAASTLLVPRPTTTTTINYKQRCPPPPCLERSEQPFFIERSERNDGIHQQKEPRARLASYIVCSKEDLSLELARIAFAK